MVHGFKFMPVGALLRVAAGLFVLMVEKSAGERVGQAAVLAALVSDPTGGDIDAAVRYQAWLRTSHGRMPGREGE